MKTKFIIKVFSEELKEYIYYWYIDTKSTKIFDTEKEAESFIEQKAPTGFYLIEKAYIKK